MKNKVVSLFSGGGGLDLGFIQNGFEIIYANDNDRAAVESYGRNISNDINPNNIYDLDLWSIPNADIILGGPPCQSFSLAGKRDVNDERSDLVWKYLEIIKKMKPKFFVFENVTGLKSAKTENGGKVIDDLIEAFSSIGYELKTQTLNAANYGVPQRRKRVFIVGNNIGVEYHFPEETHNEDGSGGKKKWVSAYEALEDFDESTEEGVSKYKIEPMNEYQKIMRENNSSNNIFNHYTPTMSDLDKTIIHYVTPGGNYMDVPDWVPSKRIQNFKKTGGRTTTYGRLTKDKPAYTINTYFNRPNVGCNIHYSKDRLITVREALRLQSFPDDYIVKSPTKRGYHTVVGNAVPPILAYHLAESIKPFLN